MLIIKELRGDFTYLHFSYVASLLFVVILIAVLYRSTESQNAMPQDAVKVANSS